MDIFLSEGFKILNRVGLALLKYREKEILQTEDLPELMCVLKDFEKFKTIDIDKFLITAHSFTFSRKLMDVNILLVN